MKNAEETAPPGKFAPVPRMTIAFDFSVFLTSQGWVVFTLTSLEIVLGIDNIVMIDPQRRARERQTRARRMGLFRDGGRIMLLFTLSFIMRMVEPLFHIGSLAVTGKDIVLISGGLFLIGKLRGDAAQGGLHQGEGCATGYRPQWVW